MTWERRWHPLRREWVTITAHRNQRPWSGAETHESKSQIPEYVRDCYLCPGNQRISGAENPAYSSVFVFDNDHPSFSENAPDVSPLSGEDVDPELFRADRANGITRVICYSPNHSSSLAQLDESESTALIQCWVDQTAELAARDDVEHVFIFENKGDVVGVSNPHPHCQVYGAPFVFKNIELELQAFKDQGSDLMSRLVAGERAGPRMLFDGEHVSAFCPYFSRFPYEAWLVPHQAHQDIRTLGSAEIAELGSALRQITCQMDNLWQTSFPYILSLHQAPFSAATAYHIHIQIQPLMRQPGLQKYLAGVETGGGNFLNDVAPESAAAAIQQASKQHYLAT